MFLRRSLLVVSTVAFAFYGNVMESMETSSIIHESSKTSKFVKKLYAAAPTNPFLSYLAGILNGNRNQNNLMEACFWNSAQDNNCFGNDSFHKEVAAKIISNLKEQDNLALLREDINKEGIEKILLAGIHYNCVSRLAVALIAGCDPNMKVGGYLGVNIPILCIVNSDAAALVLAAGGNVNLVDKNHNTPLHAACLSMDVKKISVLLESGANLIMRNLLGKTPQDIVEFVKSKHSTEHYRKVVELLDLYQTQRQQGGRGDESSTLHQ